MIEQITFVAIQSTVEVVDVQAHVPLKRLSFGEGALALVALVFAGQVSEYCTSVMHTRRTHFVGESILFALHPE